MNWEVGRERGGNRTESHVNDGDNTEKRPPATPTHARERMQLSV